MPPRPALRIEPSAVFEAAKGALTIHAAKTPLFRLIEAALAGEDVVIAKGDTPVVRPVPVPAEGFRFGVLEPGALGEGPDFMAPMDEQERADWEGRT